MNAPKRIFNPLGFLQNNRFRALLASDNVTGYLFIGPFVLGFLAFTLIPVLASIYFSFSRYDLLSPPVFDGLRNFIAMFSDENFWKSLTVTLHYAFVSVPLRLVFALFVAMLFNRKSKLVGCYRTIYYLPSIIGGSIAVSVMWRRLFMADGAVNSALALIGIKSDTSWIGNPKTAIWTLIILAAWQFGSSMLIFLAGLKQIPGSLYEAAEIDGANAFQKFFKITIPHLTPVIFFNLVMQLINGFTVFTQAFVISGGSGDPMNSTLVYALYLYRKAFEFYDMGYGCAMAWVLVLILAVFTALIFKSSSLWVYYETKED
ncbi:carbohydrate ABC transporter membrane protein 1 (CUT1 family) [Hydrogenispora ethanolica]|uniref:Carbohydrate ABC transporter membrane protein 1 (CUT1 family) n=1 Tax=Hydrogenispora ethanolica TaxID=1082276 RepID=A0A4R1RU44_HYDET|nr:carbohydrate ABC transporter membrane protein 1 (CUT1 family) [Hydrogenispora ethanolica]